MSACLSVQCPAQLHPNCDGCLGILTVKYLAVKKLHEFFEGCVFLSPSLHSYVVGWTELSTWVLLGTVLLVGCILLVDTRSRHAGRMLAVQFCIHRLVWLFQAGYVSLILLFPRCCWVCVLHSSCTDISQSASSAQNVLVFFGFGGLSPSMKPLLPLSISQLRSTGESSVQPQSEKWQRRSLQNCRIQAGGNGTSRNPRAGDSLQATKGWSSIHHLPCLTWVGGELETTNPPVPSSGGETLFLAFTSSLAKTIGTSEGFIPPQGGTCPSRDSFYAVTGVYIKCCRLESILKRFLPALH